MAVGMKVAGEEDQLRNLRAGEILLAEMIGIGMTVAVTGMIAVIWERDEMTETEEGLLSDLNAKKV